LVAGNQHWGHATSPDLYNWTNQPIALYPPREGTGVFSGSAVIDTNNTSGFFANQTNGVVAVYTLNEPDKQTQNLAFSYDNGYTFTEYENNPVLDIGSNQFRDPKVIWYEDHWVMVIAYSTEFVIGIFTSPDLIEWTHASNVSHVGLLGVQYECPNMVPVPVKGVEGEEELYVLTISLNPGAPLSGSLDDSTVPILYL
jgi:beta-fructofuranosidase